MISDVNTKYRQLRKKSLVETICLQIEDPAVLQTGSIRVLKNKNQVVRQSDFEKRSISDVSIFEERATQHDGLRHRFSAA